MKTIANSTVKKMVKTASEKNIIVDVSVGDKVVNIEVFPVIPIVKYIEMVNEAVNSVILGDDYKPYLREFSINCNVLRFFTNIDTSNIETMYDFIYTNKPTMDTIINIVLTRYPQLIEDIDEMIDYRKHCVFGRSKWDSVADNIINLTDGLSKLSTTFGNANPDDVKKALTQIGKITTNDIKDMYVNNGND